MTSDNRLSGETSPYLLQHADNPVSWRPWGPEALAEAKRDNKPVLLSVGYAACHWCHVMAHESFEDEAVAAVMNANFVNIKVDREERPDIDQIYMSALHALGEQGGWPLTMFLTPDGAPFWGGTYFPKEPRYGRPGFVNVLDAVAGVFRNEPDKIEQNRTALLERLRQRTPPAGGVDPQILDLAAARLVEVMDPVRGGTRGAPKFPNAGLFELFWRAWFRGGEARYRDAVLLSLQEICQGGIYDHLGGGFARYSVDADWLVPHFEKMLYDNAQLVALLTEAWAVTGRPLFKTRIEETVGWLVREMTTAGGAFAASLDADSEGEEGKFTVWTKAEIEAALGPEDAAFFGRFYDVSDAGNWEEKVVLNRTGQTDLLDEATEARLAGLRAKLLRVRARRVRPGLDDKVLADWNGLMIAALAHAGDVCGRDDWIALAERAYGFIVAEMTREGRLGHSWRDGRLLFPGLASDYAAMVRAALALRQARRSGRYLDDALGWCEAAERHYATGDGGFYWTADDAEALIVRPSSPADEAVPNANGLMAQNYASLFALTGAPRWREKAEALIAVHGAAMADNVFACASLLNGLDQLVGGTSVVIAVPAAAAGAGTRDGAAGTGGGGEGAGDGGTAAASGDALAAAAVGSGNPTMVVSVVSAAAALPETHPAFGKTAVAGQPAAFVCRRQTCSLPITDPAELRAALQPPG